MELTRQIRDEILRGVILSILIKHRLDWVGRAGHRVMETEHVKLHAIDAQHLHHMEPQKADAHLGLEAVAEIAPLCRSFEFVDREQAVVRRTGVVGDT